MSVQKRRLNEIKDLRWIEMRNNKKLTQARKEQNQSKTSVKRKAEEKVTKREMSKEREQ